MDASELNTLFTPNGPTTINHPLDKLAAKYHWRIIANTKWRDIFGRTISISSINRKEIYLIDGHDERNAYTTLKGIDNVYKNLKPLCNFIAELKYHRISFVIMRNQVTLQHTKLCYVEIRHPDSRDITLIHDLLCKECHKSYYTRESITNDGNINIWFYGSEKAYFDHVKLIFNQQR